jgi:hypothetical protein
VRRDAQSVDVRADSYLGATAAAPRLRFRESEVRDIHKRFRYVFGEDNKTPSSQLTQEQAAEIGKRLAKVLLPPPVFQLVGRSLSEAVRAPRGALRLLLHMDGDLAQLPWEYVYRPDHAGADQMSGFLLLDPKISLLRRISRPEQPSKPFAGKERLAFVGALWDDGRDHWKVRHEFEELRAALKPVSEYLWLDYGLGSDDEAFASRLELGASIFHYGGHCDFDEAGAAYLLREMPCSYSMRSAPKAYVRDVAASLRRGGTRLVVLSACNSGFWPAVRPFLETGVPAVLGINGSVNSDSTIEFCAKMYESLSVGLSLDEAVGRARLHLMQWNREQGLCDWGLFMVYTSAPHAVLFPRAPSSSLAAHQSQARADHREAAVAALAKARELDGLNFGEIMSDLTRRRVLILGRFTEGRLKVLEAMKAKLGQHRNNYIGELFTYDRPELRDLIESISGFAALSRFVIADLTDAKSVQDELRAIVPTFPSLPVIPVIEGGATEYSTFSTLTRRGNVVEPTLRYRDEDDLLRKLDKQVIAKAEARLRQVKPPTST